MPVDIKVGTEFANGWVVTKVLNTKEWAQLYFEETGEKIISNNTHYICENTNCGVTTGMERSTLKRNIERESKVMRYCLNCLNGSKLSENKCRYKNFVRLKKLTKIPDRSEKCKIGEKYGVFKVLDIQASKNSADHQRRALVKCLLCNQDRLIRVDTLLNGDAACDCFKQRSSGEVLVGNYLKEKGYNFVLEQGFENLVGKDGGKLRYDFALLNKDKNIFALIEFDGEQHFKEAGSYFNPTGKVQIHDNIKNKFAEEHKIPLLRIPYTEKKNINSIIDEFLSNLNE